MPYTSDRKYGNIVRNVGASLVGARQNQEEDSLRILVIRPGAIGDALLTFPILQALRNKYPQCHITFVSNVSVLPLARVLGLAEETFDFQDWQWAELFLIPGIEHKGIEGGSANGGAQESSPQKRLQHIDLAICWLRIFEDITKQNLLAGGVREPYDSEIGPLQQHRCVV